MENPICANCSIKISVDSAVVSYNKTPESNSTLSVYEALFLVFQYKEESMSHVKFCNDCGNIFQKLLKNFVELSTKTNPSSYLQRIFNRNAKDYFFEDHSYIPLSTHHNQGLMTELYPSFTDTNPLPTLENEDDYEMTTDAPLMTSDCKEDKIANSVVKSGPGQYNAVKIIIPNPHRNPTKIIHQANSVKIERNKRKTKHQVRIEPIIIDQSDDEKIKQESNDFVTCDTSSGSCEESPLSASRLGSNLPFECQICYTNYTAKGSLLRHMRERHEYKKGEPPKPKKIYTEEELALLVTTQYICDICSNVSFSTLKEWVLHHKEIHNLDFGYKDLDSKESLEPRNKLSRPCPRCGRRIRSNWEMIDHIKLIHLDSKEFSCTICNRNFSSNQILQTHQRNIHGTRERQFLCSLCGHSCYNKQNLVIHEKTHLTLVEDLAHECDICHLKFTRRRFKEHKIIAHTSERPFSCDQCDRTFKLARSLTKHKKHQHYKKYIIDEFCKECGKGYAFKTKLKEHLMASHKYSKEEARIAAGMRTNSLFRVLPNGERVYKTKPTKPKTCHICSKTYVRRGQLFTHLISVHGKTPEESKEITGLESKRDLIPNSFKMSVASSSTVSNIS